MGFQILLLCGKDARSATSRRKCSAQCSSRAARSRPSRGPASLQPRSGERCRGCRPTWRSHLNSCAPPPGRRSCISLFPAGRRGRHGTRRADVTRLSSCLAVSRFLNCFSVSRLPAAAPISALAAELFSAPACCVATRRRVRAAAARARHQARVSSARDSAAPRAPARFALRARRRPRQVACLLGPATLSRQG